MPEIKRLDLAEVALTLKAAGVRDLRAFRWLEPPEENTLRRAEELLADLGAIQAPSAAATTAGPGTEAGQPGLEITEIGRKMLAFPVHPRFARLLLAAQDQGCVSQACLLAALTQGRDLLSRKVDAATSSSRENLLDEGEESDFDLLMRAWESSRKNGFQAERLPAPRPPPSRRAASRTLVATVSRYRAPRGARHHGA